MKRKKMTPQEVEEYFRSQEPDWTPYQRRIDRKTMYGDKHGPVRENPCLKCADLMHMKMAHLGCGCGRESLSWPRNKWDKITPERRR